MKNFICGLVFGVGVGMLLAGQILYAQWESQGTLINPVQPTEVYPELWMNDPPIHHDYIQQDAWREGLSNPCNR